MVIVFGNEYVMHHSNYSKAFYLIKLAYIEYLCGGPFLIRSILQMDRNSLWRIITVLPEDPTKLYIIANLPGKKLRKWNKIDLRAFLMWVVLSKLAMEIYTCFRDSKANAYNQGLHAKFVTKILRWAIIIFIAIYLCKKFLIILLLI